jgi:RNA polymerase sigma factor (TIGR02999 family)
MGDDITGALEEWASGDAAALDRIAPAVYPKLRELAGAFFRGERPGHTWQATALVSELFVKLASARGSRFESRLHFYNACARIMRRALIDHARGVRAEKRGSELTFVPLHEELGWLNAAGPEVLDLDRALDELAEMDGEQAAMFETHYLLGCGIEETAELFGTSKSTVDRKVRLARAWLYRRLRPAGGAVTVSDSAP